MINLCWTKKNIKRTKQNLGKLKTVENFVPNLSRQTTNFTGRCITIVNERAMIAGPRGCSTGHTARVIIVT